MRHAYYDDPEWLRKRREAMKKLWADPEYRKKIISKQKKIGYRNYGDGIYYSKNRRKVY